MPMEIEELNKLAAREAALKLLEERLAAFNAQDVATWKASCNFPFLRVGPRGRVTLIRAADMVLAPYYRRLRASGWHHSAWTRREVIHAGPAKVHIDTTFVRYDAAGKELLRFDALYIVTLQDGHWGLKVQSNYVR